MDFVDVFEDLKDLITEETEETIKGTNETIEGLWFSDGVRKNTGETFFWTTIGDSLEGRNPIAQIGSIIDVPISKYVGMSSAGYESFQLDPSIMFYAHSKTGVLIAPTEFGMHSNAGHFCSKDPAIATVPRNVRFSDDYANAWTDGVYESEDYNKSWVVNLRLWNEEQGKYNDPIAVSSLPANSIYDGAPYLMNSKTIDWYWAHSKFGNLGADLAFSNTFNRNGISYIQCVAFRDDANQRICVAPLLNGFRKDINADEVDIYNIECINKDYLVAAIPYIILNNPNYFNPEEDAGDKRPDPEDPDYESDTSHPGGGGGNYINYPSDDIGLPELPTVSAIDTGFLTMYHPTNAQLQSLVNYLWTSDWIDNIKKMVANPMDAIISLQLAPYTINSFVSSTCKIGAVNTEIGMSKVTNQYQILNCGSVKVPEHWGNALDYNNVNISVYLPFVGIRTLDTNIIMNSSVGLAYYVDLLTGSAIAMLIVQKTGTSQSVYYTFDCNLNYQIPITGANYSETIKALLSVGASAVGAGMAVGTGNAPAALGATASMVGSAFMAGSGAHHYESSGSLSANTGLLGQYQPYIIIELPKQSLPRDFKKIKGYTSNITATLGSLSGFTVVDSVHVDDIPMATDSEKEEIEALLKGGVIL